MSAISSICVIVPRVLNAEPSCTCAVGSTRHSFRPLYRNYSIGTTVYSGLARGLLTGKVRGWAQLRTHEKLVQHQYTSLRGSACTAPVCANGRCGLAWPTH